MIRRGLTGRRSLGPTVAFAILAGLTCAPAYDAPNLFEDLKHSDPEVRLDAMEKIDRIMREGDYGVFVRGADSVHPMHKVQSILYLSRMTQPEAREALRQFLRLDRRMMLPFNPIRLTPTRQQHDSRILVAHLIAGGGGDAEALPALLDGLDQEESPEVLTGTCFAIGALGDSKGVPFLAAAVRNPDVEVARAAVQALGRFHEPEVVDALKEGASHASVPVRSDVLSSLEQWDGPVAVDLVKSMASSDPALDIRAAAIRRLGTYQDPTLVPFLIDFLGSEDVRVRSAAEDALRTSTGQSLGARPDRWSRWWEQNKERATSRR